MFKLQLASSVPLRSFCDPLQIQSTLFLMTRLLFSYIEQIDTVKIKCKTEEYKSEDEDSIKSNLSDDEKHNNLYFSISYNKRIAFPAPVRQGTEARKRT